MEINSLRPINLSCLVLLWAVLSAVCPSFSAAQADDKGWVLTQKSTTLGDQYVYISSNGLKCVNPRAGFALVTHAPDWNVVLFNDKTKVYFETTLDKWKQQLSNRGLSSPMSGKSWSKGGSAQIAGLKATEYVMRGGATTFQMAVRSAQHARQVTIQGANYFVSDEITVPPKLADLLSTAYGLPPTQNVPLRLNCVESGRPRVLLDTYHMELSAIPISYFQCPQGYKPVKSDAEVMMTDDQRQMIEDMTKEMGDIK